MFDGFCSKAAVKCLKNNMSDQNYEMDTTFPIKEGISQQNGLPVSNVEQLVSEQEETIFETLSAVTSEERSMFTDEASFFTEEDDYSEIVDENDVEDDEISSFKDDKICSTEETDDEIKQLDEVKSGTSSKEVIPKPSKKSIEFLASLEETKKRAESIQQSFVSRLQSLTSLLSPRNTLGKWSTPSVLLSLTHLIRKSAWNLPKASSEKSLYDYTSTASKESLLTVIEPKYTNSQYELPLELNNVMMSLLLKESIRSILSETPFENVGFVLREFLECFIDSTHLQVIDLDVIVKRILASSEFWEDTPKSSEKTETSQIKVEIKNLICCITAEAIGDILQEWLDDPNRKQMAKEELQILEKTLRKLTLEKGYIEIYVPVKKYLLNTVENLDAKKGIIKCIGHPEPNLYLIDVDILALCKAIKIGLWVQKLDLKNNSITDFGVWHLASLLKTSDCCLKYLSLSGNKMTAKGIIFLSDALKVNISLQELILSENNLLYQGGMNLISGLRANSTLQALDLANTGLRIGNIIALILTATEHSSLQSLNLNRPLLFSEQEEPTVHLSKLFKINRQIQEIHLQKFGMTDDGIYTIVKGLFYNQTLCHLDLSCNRIVWNGAAYIAEFLASNKTLQILNLHANRIEDNGTKSLANILANRNQTLRRLIISFNNIGTDGLMEIVSCLKKNTGLVSLDIWGNNVQPTVSKALKILLDNGRLNPKDVDFHPYMCDGSFYLAKAFKANEEKPIDLI